MQNPSASFAILVLTRELAESLLPQLLEIDRDVPGQTWEEANFLSDLPGKWEISRIALHDSGRLAAFIIGSVKGDAAHIHREAVARDFRRNGLALRLMGAAGAAISSKGISRVTGKVHVSNEPSRKMLERLGWRITGQVDTNLLIEIESARLAQHTET